jgi:hypothetical protein
MHTLVSVASSSDCCCEWADYMHSCTQVTRVSVISSSVLLAYTQCHRIDMIRRDKYQLVPVLPSAVNTYTLYTLYATHATRVRLSNIA